MVVDAVVVFDELYVAVLLAESVAVETLNVLVAVTVGAKPVEAGAATVALVKIGRGTTDITVLYEAAAETTIGVIDSSENEAVFDEMASARNADAADASSTPVEPETVAAVALDIAAEA